MDNTNDEKGAAVKFPPPLIFLSVIFFSYVLHYFWPIGIADVLFHKYIGIIILGLGISIVIIGKNTFSRAQTNIEPWKPTKKIITTGIYKYSRNPIYLALCVMQVGIGIIVNSLWMIISLAISVALVYHTAIKKEEIYLAAKFGDEYKIFKNKVRRWL